MPTIADIQRAVCAEFGLEFVDLQIQTKRARIAWPRQVSMGLCRELTAASYQDIVNRHHRGHHTTARHAWLKLGRIEAAGGAAADRIDRIRTAIELLPSAQPSRSYGTWARITVWRPTREIGVRFTAASVQPRAAASSARSPVSPDP